MILDPDDAIRRMEKRHASKPDIEKEITDTMLSILLREEIRTAFLARMLEDHNGTFDIAIDDLKEFRFHNVRFETYMDETATAKTRAMRLKVTANRE